MKLIKAAKNKQNQNFSFNSFFIPGSDEKSNKKISCKIFIPHGDTIQSNDKPLMKEKSIMAKVDIKSDNKIPSNFYTQKKLNSKVKRLLRKRNDDNKESEYDFENTRNNKIHYFSANKISSKSSLICIDFPVISKQVQNFQIKNNINQLKMKQVPLKLKSITKTNRISMNEK